MTTSSYINKIIESLSEEELNTEVKLATYFECKANTQTSSETTYVDENLETGEILPWAVKAAWDGQDLSQADGSASNFGEGSYAFVIDSGVQKLDDLNIEENGWSKSYIENTTAFTDGNGHGTHVAGTIGAKVNGKGVIGVAPGALITSIKVFNSSGGGASYGTILNAINYAAEIIINNNLPKEKCVINLSLGGPNSPAIDLAVKNLASLGIQFAIAAGNEGQDADNVSPAGAGDADNVYTVSAVDNKMVMASFSNWDDPNGGDDVDVAAGGVNVLSYYKNGELTYLNGTSMATPAVAGLLITGGLKNGDLVKPNGAGYADPFAITTISGGEQPPVNENPDEDSPVDEPDETPVDEPVNENPGNEDPDDDETVDESPDSDLPEDVETVEFLGDASGGFGSFYLTSGNGSVKQSVLEKGLGLSDGTLDGTLGGTKSAINATEGSSVKITGDAKVGDKLSFNYSFSTNDYLPYADYSFWTLNNKAFTLAALGKNVSDYGSLGESVEYTFTAEDFGGANSGTISVGFGVVDSKDYIVDSFLQISELIVDSPGSDTEQPDGDNPDDDGFKEPTYKFLFTNYGNTTAQQGTESGFDLSTGYNSISQYNLEKALELSTGILDGSLGGTKGSINATEGSALKATTNAKAGDTITFDYSFSTNDYQPFKDFAFFSINGTANKIAAVGEDVPNFGSKIGSVSYTLSEQDFIGDSNEVVLGIGVMDALDNVVDTQLSVENIAISSGGGGGEQPDAPEVTQYGFIDDSMALYGDATEDNGVFELTTDKGAVSQSSLENSLGLITDTLDTNLNATKSAINATEGSAIKLTGTGKAGDSISFDYTFKTSDYTPFKDFSFYSVNNKTYKVVAIGEDVPNYGEKSGKISYTLTDSDIKANSSFTLSVGVSDALDTAATSSISVSNIQYIQASSDTPVEDIELSLTTFGNTYKYGNKWNMSTSSGSISQNLLESGLKLATGTLDTSLGGTKTAINATEGSGLYATAKAKAGDTLTFNYTFSTNDYSPYKDFSFVSVNGNAINIAAIGQEVSDYGTITSSYSYTLKIQISMVTPLK